MANARVRLMQIAEIKPDTFSSGIMWLYNQCASHCVTQYLKTGMCWESTTPGDTREVTLEEALKDCRIVYERELELDVSEEIFEHWLEQKRGIPYAHRQVWGYLFSIFQKRVEDGDLSFSCSEFQGRLVNENIHDLNPLKLHRRSDWYTPRYLRVRLQMKRVDQGETQKVSTWGLIKRMAKGFFE